MVFMLDRVIPKQVTGKPRTDIRRRRETAAGSRQSRAYGSAALLRHLDGAQHGTDAAAGDEVEVVEQAWIRPARKASRSRRIQHVVGLHHADLGEAVAGAQHRAFAPRVTIIASTRSAMAVPSSPVRSFSS